MSDEKNMATAAADAVAAQVEGAEKPEVAAAAATADPASTPESVSDAFTNKAFSVLVHEDGKFARGVLWYGRWLTFAGWFDMIVLVLLTGLVGLLVALNGQAVIASEMINGSLASVLSVADFLLSFFSAFVMIKLGKSLRKSVHRKAAVWARFLMWCKGVELALSYMLSGPSFTSVITLLEVIVLIIFSVALDPTLVRERRDERAAGLAADKDAAAQGMLGRDLSGKGFIRVDFFNLFWMFFVCCILGLVLEIIWHMTVVDFGQYEDRAGLLFGPFSPIYGFGAVLVTLSLNRLYNKNPVITFVVAGIVGGAFEWAVAFFMETSFGITAWNYSDYNFFGIPDPVAVFSGGRTATQFLIIWGILGLVWVKFFLPIMLKVINVIPWTLRYSLTTAMAVLMLLNGLMTLGSLDCWYMRASGVQPETPIEQFFGDFFPDTFMKNRFQSMSMNTDSSTRVDAVRKSAD